MNAIFFRNKSSWPLSLLAFRAFAISMALPRKPVKSLKSVKQFLMENYRCHCDGKL